MPAAAPPEIHTRLDDGTPVCFRAIRPADETKMRAGIAQMSERSRYLRFFTGLRMPPDQVIARLLRPDGRRHIAWGALASALPGEPAIGAVHAYAADDAGEACAEFSVATVDAFHGRGLGRLLTATLLLDAARLGYREFQAWTLAENAAAIGFVKALGAELAGHDGPLLEYHLPVAEAIESLRESCEPAGLADVFAAFSPR